MPKKQAMPKQRPPIRDRYVNVRIDPITLDDATNKAKQQGATLSVIIRAFLRLWVNDEVPEGFPPVEPIDSNYAAQSKRRRGGG